MHINKITEIFEGFLNSNGAAKILTFIGYKISLMTDI
jgi:hypothetical protein